MALEDDIEKVRASRLKGVRTVQYSDRSVTFTSDAEKRQVEADLIARQNPTRRRQYRLTSTKGFDA